MSVPTVRAKSVSPQVVRACAAFGLVVERGGDGDRASDVYAGTVVDRLLALEPGETAAITGPSGAGKSTLIQALAARLRAAGERVVMTTSLRLRERPIAELFGPGLARACRALSSAGLAEARLLARTPSELSEGERFRLRLALAIDRLTRGRARDDRADGWIIADEFASSLDALTALGVGAAARRVAARAGIRLVAAGVRSELASLVGARVRVRCRLGAAPVVCEDHTPPADPLGGVVIEPGSMADYAALARFHYRAGAPATHTLVLRATHPMIPDAPAAVLVVSMPTRNGAWRARAWGERYTARGASCDRAAVLGRINRELRCVSRVVVDPRLRGVGLAARMVRAYLAQPQTCATEAIAAMGAVSPFFASSGMTAYTMPVPARDARFADALACAGIDAASLTTDRAAERALRHGLVARELAQWAAAARSRAIDALPRPVRLRVAASRAAAADMGLAPVAYAAVESGSRARISCSRSVRVAA